jgi:MerR family transcriptional regulator, mercuric resistance operon regulatory protein
MRNDSTDFAIGRIAERTGTKVETIRYYEHVGLLPRAPRTAGGYRLYNVQHIKRLSFIRRARALGFHPRGPDAAPARR